MLIVLSQRFLGSCIYAWTRYCSWVGYSFIGLPSSHVTDLVILEWETLWWTSRPLFLEDLIFVDRGLLMASSLLRHWIAVLWATSNTITLITVSQQDIRISLTVRLSWGCTDKSRLFQNHQILSPTTPLKPTYISLVIPYWSLFKWVLMLITWSQTDLASPIKPLMCSSHCAKKWCNKILLIVQMHLRLLQFLKSYT